MKYQVNEISSQWNIKSMKYWVNKILSQWNIESIKYWVNGILSQWNIESMEYQVYEKTTHNIYNILKYLFLEEPI